MLLGHISTTLSSYLIVCASWERYYALIMQKRLKKERTQENQKRRLSPSKKGTYTLGRRIKLVAVAVLVALCVKVKWAQGYIFA